jgi:hypothetical protein
MLGELGEDLRLGIPGEEVGEDALQGGPCGRNARARQVTVQFKNIESVNKTIIGFLVQSILLTHPPYWRKIGVRQ